MDKSGKQVFPIDDSDDLLRGLVVSANECTGLMYKPPLTQDDVSSYTDIYDVPQPGNNPLNDSDKTKERKTGQSK